MLATIPIEPKRWWPQLNRGLAAIPCWGLKMTCCIGVACEYRGKPALVFCSDYRIENAEAGAETETKLRWVRHNWPTLFAGEVSKAEELIQTYSEHFQKNAGPLTDSNFLDALKFPAHLFKRKIADDHVRSKLGITYTQFLQKGKQKLPADAFREVVFEIKYLELGCELLIAGFIDNWTHILTIDQSGTLGYSRNFAVVGSGSSIASAALFQREHHHGQPLEIALYHVFEAHTLARIAPGVGKEALITVFHPPEKEDGDIAIRFLNKKGRKLLGEEYKKYGLKKLGAISVPKECFD